MFEVNSPSLKLYETQIPLLTFVETRVNKITPLHPLRIPSLLYLILKILNDLVGLKILFVIFRKL